MRSKDPQILKSSLEFAAKFGFLSKAIFYDFLCPRGDTQKYMNWKGLTEDGYFRKSRQNGDLLYLSPKGLKVCGTHAVRSRFYYYLNHDTHVARVLFAIQSTGLCIHFWTEAELQMLPWDALSILGSGNLNKIPDLVVDLKSSTGTMRFAIEIEASRKSNHKYDQIALAYLTMKKVNLVIFFCETDIIEMQIHRAFHDEIFLKAEKSPATVILSEFQVDNLKSKIKLLDRTFELVEFLARALGIPQNSENLEPNQNRKPIRLSTSEDLESA